MAKKFKRVLARAGFFKTFSNLFLFLWRVMPILLLVVLTALGIFWVRHSLYGAKLLNLEKVRMIGLESLKADDILKLADLKKGINLLGLDLERAVKGIRRDPRVKSVSLRKVFPNRLEIRITERRPVLQIYSPSEKLYYLIDEEGVMLPGPLKEPHGEYLIFDDKTAPDFQAKPGGRYPSGHLEKLLKYYEILENDPLIDEEKVRRLTVDELDFWTLVTEDGIEFRLGENFDNLNKLENYRLLLHSEVRQTLDYLDLRFQDAVVKIKKKDKV